MTRHRLPATLWNSPELSTADEPEPPREKAWWVDDGTDDGRAEPMPGDGTDGPCDGYLWSQVP